MAIYGSFTCNTSVGNIHILYTDRHVELVNETKFDYMRSKNKTVSSLISNICTLIDSTNVIESECVKDELKRIVGVKSLA